MVYHSDELVASLANRAAELVPLVAEHDGPVYLRVSRADVTNVFNEEYRPQIGKGTVLREGNNATIVATGVMVERTLRASEQLRTAGIATRVLALHTIKPLDRQLLLAAAAETGAVVAVEEHSIVGGLGSAVAELLAGEAPVPVVRVGLPDTFAETGPYEALLDRYGMSVEHIVSAAKRAIALRRSGIVT